MTVHVFWPNEKFIQISITGGQCALQCPHCQARYLKHMAPALTPRELYSLAEVSAKKAVRGMLISGGCDASGQVPIFNYLDIIKNIKENIDISINIHTGFIHLGNIPKLRDRGIDIVSFDVIGSPVVVKKIYGLELESGYFDKALAAFRDNGLKAVPHVTAGLDMGNDSGEEAAFEIIYRHRPDFVVINALMSPETDAISAARLIKVLEMAREILPDDTAIGLGCMRPRGDILTATMANELGIAAIAMPSKKLLNGLRGMGLEIDEKDGCCAFYEV